MHSSKPAEQRRNFTIQEYLEFERTSQEKHEFIDGRIFGLFQNRDEGKHESAATHSLITANAIREIGSALKGRPFQIYDSSLSIVLVQSSTRFHPDLSITSGAMDFLPGDEKQDGFTNPIVLAEVLSSSTEAHDRGQKFREYRKIESLLEYVLISQHAPNIETFYRNDDGDWVFDAFTGMDNDLILKSLGIRISLREIYAGVNFSTQ